jgi:hypothetical protein
MNARRLDDQDPEIIRLDLGIEDITLGHLIEAQERFLSLIREVAGGVVGNKEDVRWIVEDVEANSLDLALRASPARESVPKALMADVVSAVARGLERIEREAYRPPYFSDAALQQAHELARLRGRGVTRIQVKAAVAEATVTTRTVANVEEVVGQTITAIGTIEGTLEAVTVHGDRVFYVYDPLTGHKTRCDFGYRIPAAQVGQAVEHRVAVTGEIRYRENGTLVGIRAEELRVLEDASELPNADDVLGILAGH